LHGAIRGKGEEIHSNKYHVHDEKCVIASEAKISKGKFAKIGRASATFTPEQGSMMSDSEARRR
jgi:hypothetical protein